MTSTTSTQPAAEFTRETMRADIARILHESPEEIGDDDSLIDLGLDSIRAMTLVTRWRDRGIAIDFSQLAEQPCLSHWWLLAQAATGSTLQNEQAR